ncbi:hypothetical protein PV341_21635 [Streptomyces sp. PA03-1a]|nr:hypothetical protein [Streptomyces sp. PA03-1a]MDX2817317.1 hypothetical protein [Streptomyces sp. PA03-5A]
MLLTEIDAVNWNAIPTPRPRPRTADARDGARAERPDPAAGLRALAAARDLEGVASAVAALTSSSLLRGRTGEVLPGAVVAAPFLLDIAEQGHPHARESAVVLLDGAMRSAPLADFSRFRTPAGHDAPLCCAIAELVRARRDSLAECGRSGKYLLKASDAHWRFDIREASGASGASGEIVALGILQGGLPAPSSGGELHHDGSVTAVGAVGVECPPVDATAEACLRLSGLAADAADGGELAGAVLYPAACGGHGR